MKTFTQKIYLFLSISLIAGNLSIVKANNNSKDMYKTLWEEVKKLENQALPKSALEKVEEIYALALKEGVDVQIVKASIYRLKYTNILEEDGYKKAILKLESEISKTSGAAKSMLHLLLGKMYSTYYYNNAYLINQRSVTYDFDLSDLQTWDKTRFQDKIIKNYFQAIDKTLEQIDIIDFEELITEAENSKPRFETLFDFVVYTAIKDLSSSNYDSWQYYTFNETNEYKFKNESFFTEAEEFTKIKLSYDTLSFNYSILKLYQDWLEIKLTNSDNLASLIMVDIDRLDFVLNNFNSEEKENLWLESVEKLHTKYSDKPELMYIVFKLALYYEKLAKQYDFENPLKLKYKDYNKNAIALINEALEKFPQAYYYKECENIKIRIEKTSLSFTSEKITSSGNKFPLRISYKNLEEVYNTVLSLD